MGDGGNGKAEVKPSRVIVEFAGPGSADIVKIQFSQITPGQWMVLAKFMEGRAEMAVGEMLARLKPQVGSKLVVPRIFPGK